MKVCSCRLPAPGPLYWDWRCRKCDGRIVGWQQRRVERLRLRSEGCRACGYPHADRYGAQREALERIALGVHLGRVDLDEAARIASAALAGNDEGRPVRSGLGQKPA